MSCLAVAYRRMINFRSPAPLSPAEAYLLFNVRRLGKGRLAVTKEDDLDAYFMCADIQNILSHRGDPVRLYNGSSMNCFYQASAQGRQGVIQVLNYSRRPGSTGALVCVKTPCRSARFVSLELASPVPLQWVAQEAGGAELSLPAISVHGAVQMESQEVKETTMKKDFSRREWLAGAGAAAGCLLTRPTQGFAATPRSGGSPSAGARLTDPSWSLHWRRCSMNWAGWAGS